MAAMRLLKISTSPLPPEKRAQALALLAQLRATQPFPLAALGAEEKPFFAFLISLAQQYPGDWESLLTAGYMEVARMVAAGAKKPRWNWWAREGMAGVGMK